LGHASPAQPINITIGPEQFSYANHYVGLCFASDGYCFGQCSGLRAIFGAHPVWHQVPKAPLADDCGRIFVSMLIGNGIQRAPWVVVEHFQVRGFPANSTANPGPAQVGDNVLIGRGFLRRSFFSFGRALSARDLHRWNLGIDSNIPRTSITWFLYVGQKTTGSLRMPARSCLGCFPPGRTTWW